MDIGLIVGLLIFILIVLYMEGYLDTWTTAFKTSVEGYANPMCPPCPCANSGRLTVSVDNNTGVAGMNPFEQIGYLVRQAGSTAIGLPARLPLYGQASRTRRGRYNYYVIADKLQLPIMYNKRNCSAEIGCDELYDGQEVMIPDDGNAVYVTQIYDD